MQTVDPCRKRAARLLKKAGIVVTPEELADMEITDLGLGDLDHLGVQIIVYVNNDRYCAKELILLPWQICPEHAHPPIDRTNIGKQETFRCRWGEVYLYTEGVPTPSPRARVPERYRQHLRAGREIVLLPGDQVTIPPDIRHWFQAGKKGAVVSEFSSPSLDEADVFTDPAIVRVPG